MKSHPILFSDPMIRALLNTKLRTWAPEPADPTKQCKGVTRRLSKQWLKVKKGDNLWVRETWGLGGARLLDPCLNYRADGTQRPVNRHKAGADLWYPYDSEVPITSADLLKPSGDGWHSSMFMPRWACRIELECLEDARPERLQDITEDDARLEGAEPWHMADLRPDGELRAGPSQKYRAGFHELWAALHNKPGERWEDNPELVRVGPFSRVR